MNEAKIGAQFFDILLFDALAVSLTPIDALSWRLAWGLSIMLLTSVYEMTSLTYEKSFAENNFDVLTSQQNKS